MATPIFNFKEGLKQLDMELDYILDNLKLDDEKEQAELINLLQFYINKIDRMEI